MPSRLSGGQSDDARSQVVQLAKHFPIPSNVDPAYFVDEPIVFRRFACPSCHVQVGAEVTKANEPVKAEMVFA